LAFIIVLADHFFKVSELPNDGVKNIILSEAMLTYFKHAIVVMIFPFNPNPRSLAILFQTWSFAFLSKEAITNG
jgi:hypothetical protein